MSPMQNPVISLEDQPKLTSLLITKVLMAMKEHSHFKRLVICSIF